VGKVPNFYLRFFNRDQCFIKDLKPQIIPESPKDLKEKSRDALSLLKENKQGRRMLPRLYMPLSNNSYSYRFILVRY